MERDAHEPSADTDVESQRPHVLVFSGGATKIVPLPTVGQQTVGVDDTGRVYFEDVDPRHIHVQLVADGFGFRAVKGSGNQEVLVNQTALKDEIELTSGDTISIASTDMIIHIPHGLVPQFRSIMEAGEFLRRLHEEVERATRYNRPFALLLVLTSTSTSSGTDQDAVSSAILDTVRFVDVVGRDDATDGFALILPETGDAAEVPARRLLDALTPLAPEARVGIALCPRDGLRASDLVTAARLAATASHVGTINRVAETAADHRAARRPIIALDPKMIRLLDLAENLAGTELPVLITGETGVGKDIFANAIHEWSPRARKKIVTVNCAAFAESLLEAELFGHERGAFTGAVGEKPGLLGAASGGTLFLDEICEASQRTQVELLRVLETKRVRRVGGTTEREIDIRIISATNRDPELQIDQGRFRRDLFYRLSAATMTVPPLANRSLDIPPLARHFLENACNTTAREPISIPDATMKRLLLHHWPGNVRELKNLMDYLAATVEGPILEPRFLPDNIAAKEAPWLKTADWIPDAVHAPDTPTPSPHSFRKLADEIEELERTRITQALHATGGVRARAAALLEMPLRTFVTKIKKYGLTAIPSARRKKARPG